MTYVALTTKRLGFCTEKSSSENSVMPVANSASLDCKALTIGSLDGLNFLYVQYD